MPPILFVCLSWAKLDTGVYYSWTFTNPIGKDQVFSVRWYPGHPARPQLAIHEFENLSSKTEQKVHIMWEGAPSCYKPHFVKMIELVIGVRVQNLIITDSSACSINETLWNHHIIGMHSAADCVFLLCVSRCWISFRVSGPQIRVDCLFANPGRSMIHAWENMI